MTADPMSMAASSYPPLVNPMAVISPHFCAPYPVDLTIVKKAFSISDGNFAVTDVNGTVMFKVKGSLLSLRDRRLLLDASGNPIVTLRRKVLTAHRRWQAFRGDSSDSRDLIFNTKQSSIIQLKTDLDVFLAANTKEDVCDFKVKGSWMDRSCIVYSGDSNAIVAQMHKKHTVQSVVLGKDTFAVTVYPNIDYSFIVSLIVILDEIHEEKED